jgi:carbohydrate-binding DOMON domain-containing protein
VRFDGTSACAARSLPRVGTSELAAACDPVDTATDSGTVRVTVPLTALRGLQSGDRLLARLVTPTALTPSDAPGLVVVPDIGGFDVVLDVTDPGGDDHGPGTYAYPTDAVFTPGSFDLTAFQLGTAGDDVVLVFDVGAPVANPWGSPTGLSVQTFDVYIDGDPARGDRLLLGGRNAALGEGDGWDAAVTIEGWASKVVRVGPDGSRAEDRPTIGLTVLRDQGRVIARVPRSSLGVDSDPSTWRVAVALLSQEGYPSAGVDRVRDVQPTAEQWKLGGGTGDVNETRIIDLLQPEADVQEEALSDYPASTASQAELTATDVARVPLIP